MKRVLQTALLADGTSDKALIPILRWTLRDLRPEGEFSDPQFIFRRHRNLAETTEAVLREYKPDILFVHRDAENAPMKERMKEMPVGDRLVPVVPVKMTEAWLLIDERAIRMATSNPNGSMRLDLPKWKDLEKIQAKTVLHELLQAASGNTGRRLRSFNVEQAVHRVAELVEDYAVLRNLAAYEDFRHRLEAALGQLGW
ncbi:hypothetical protein KKD52_06360 [Myxococcota bacterium]|nr:hypothetical protein [Myxococcota bacterium]MBU1412004.1 hypothetical protein [Myxococcota bacterium]MBU1509966.1 hypothetical protein [Myxococcota bacterium]